MVHGELVGVLGEVEDDGDGDDEDDGEEVGSQELGDDVAVEPGEEISFYVLQILLHYLLDELICCSQD